MTIILGNTYFVREKYVFTLFWQGPAFGMYKVFKSEIRLYTLKGELIGFINNEGFLGRARTDGKERRYSHGVPDCLKGCDTELINKQVSEIVNLFFRR